MSLPSVVLLIVRGTLELACRLVRAVFSEGVRHAWKRAPLLLLLWCAIAFLNVLHIAGFVADAVLFHEFRRVGVKQPVFILGIPRSGTTFLHRVLAGDDRFSTLTTWEALLAPSIAERHVYRFLGRIFSPLDRLTAGIRRRLFGRMDVIHTIKLREAEEDFLLLLPIQACLLLLFVCPASGHYRRLADFDRQCSPGYRRRVMAYYRFCLQKHLHFHGGNKVLLSKNPSFTSWSAALKEEFPDARFIACVRPPEEAVPSQLSALRPAMKLLAGGTCSADLQRQLLYMLHDYYRIIRQNLQSGTFRVVTMSRLQFSLAQTVLDLYDAMTVTAAPSFLRTLEEEDARARNYRSRHRYRPEEFGLTREWVLGAFADVWPLNR